MQKMKRYIGYGLLDICLTLLLMYLFGAAPGISGYLEDRTPGRMAMYAALAFAAATAIMLAAGKQISRQIGNLDIRGAYTDFCCRFHLAEKKELWLLIILAAVGAYLRFSGIGWGIDHIFQPDEKKLVRKAIEMAAELTPYNDYTGYPNQFVSKFAALAMLVYSRLFDVKLRGNTIACYFIFRGVVACLSTALIPLSYLIGNYLRRGAGIIFAALVTFFPPFVNYAKQVTGDINVLFFSALVLLCSFYYMDKKRKRDILGMTLFAAIVALEKWHGGVICLYIALIIVYVRWKEWKALFAEGLLAAVSWFGWIFIIAPNVIWDIGGTIEAIASIFVSGTKNVRPDNMAVFYPDCFYSHGGIICLLLSMGGLIYVLRHRERKFLILLLGLLNWIVMSGMMNRNFERWGMDCYYALLLLMALGLYALWKADRRVLRAAGTIAALAVACTYFLGSMRYVLLATQSVRDTRLIGEEVLWEWGVKMDNSIYDYYTPFSPGGIRAVEEGEGQKSKSMQDYVWQDTDGTVYVTEPDVLYAVTSSDRDCEGQRLLAENALLLANIPTSMGDLFRSDCGLGSAITPEPVNCKRLWDVIQEIRAGESMGPEINVYDISMLPRQERNQD